MAYVGHVCRLHMVKCWRLCAIPWRFSTWWTVGNRWASTCSFEGWEQWRLGCVCFGAAAHVRWLSEPKPAACDASSVEGGNKLLHEDGQLGSKYQPLAEPWASRRTKKLGWWDRCGLSTYGSCCDFLQELACGEPLGGTIPKNQVFGKCCSVRAKMVPIQFGWSDASAKAASFESYVSQG